jgi:DNA-binding transcriptional LysR family regulator
MELRHLRYFVAVAEEMNFSRAAERLYIAQPPLTRLIHALEAELGIELFERRKRQISLTPAGEAFLDQAYVILAQCEEAVQMAQRISRGEIGQLRVGFCETAICSFLPEAIRLYEELFPGVRVLLRNMTPVRVQEQVRALQEHRLDVVIAAAHSQKPDIDTERILSCPLMIALPETHPLSECEIVPLSALAEETWILLARHLNPAQHELCLRLCRQAGFEPRVIRPCSSVHVGLSLVAAQCGVALGSAPLQRLRWQGVIYRQIQPASSIDFYLMWRREETSALIPAFLSKAREVSTRFSLPSVI